VAETHDSPRLEEEAAWVARTLAGDTRGFDSLMRRYHAPLRRMLRAMLRDETDADDMLQETFLRAFRFLNRFDPARPFGPWLLQIGANLGRNRLRQRTSRAEVPLEASPAGEDEPALADRLADPRALDEIEHRLLAGSVRRAMDGLPEDLRVALEMRVLAEMSYQEIARSLSIPIGTVMSRLHRARARVQAALADLAPVASRGDRPADKTAPEVS
jgi:RNA polymerase sigma-70 factor, ECF subfamily